MAESGIDLIWRAWYLDAPLCNNKRRLHQDRANQVLGLFIQVLHQHQAFNHDIRSTWYQCPQRIKKYIRHHNDNHRTTHHGHRKTDIHKRRYAFSGRLKARFNVDSKTNKGLFICVIKPSEYSI